MSDEIKTLVTCVACDEPIVKARSATEETVRAKMLVIKSGLVYAVCKKCSSETPIPLRKSFDSVELYLEK